MKFTTGSLLRDFNKLSLSSLPDNERTYIQALQTPPSLLLLRAHSSLGQELVIGAAIDHAYELVHNAWQPMDGILDAQLFVFSPACVMLASGNAKISSSGAGNDWEIRFEKSGEALVLVKAWKGGRIEIGGEGIRFEMSKMEVWKSHEDMH